MRKSILGAWLVLILCSLAAWKIISVSPGTTAASTVLDSTIREQDILPQILAFNDKANLPGRGFRPGHVNPTTLNNYLEKTEYGYVIKLPAATTIPTPAVANGNIYVSGGFGSREYYSFNSVTGKMNWAVSLDDDGPSAAAVEDNTIVFNTESCTIFACDLVTGKQLWSYYLGDPLMSMPSIVNGVVFTSYPASYTGIGKKNNQRGTTLNFPTHVLIAIELKTGKILWQKWIDSDIMSAPVAKGNLLYVTTFSGAMYKVRQATGEIVEAKSMRATSAPVFNGRNEVIVSRRTDTERDSTATESIVFGYGTKQTKVLEKKAAYLDKNVQSKATYKNAAAVMDAGNGFAGGAPATSNYMAAQDNIGYSNVSSLQAFQGSRGLYTDGRLYNTMGDEVVCTDSSGALKWKRHLGGNLEADGGFAATPPLYAGGYVIVATLSGEVLLMDQKDGTTSKKYTIKDPVRYQPVVDNGWIYVATANGRMHAINTGDKKITGWNMWGGNAARTNTAAN